MVKLTKPLTVLFVSLALAESLIMVLLGLFFSDNLGVWLPTIFDASLISIIAIAVISYQLKKHTIAFKLDRRNEWIALEIGIIVFSVEAFIMLLAELLPTNLPFWQIAILDTVMLSVLSVWLINRCIFKPAIDYNESRSNTFEPIAVSSLLAFSCFVILFLMILLTTYSQIVKQQKQSLALHNLNELKQTKQSILFLVQNSTLDLLSIANHPTLSEYMSHKSVEVVHLEQHYFNTIHFKPYYDQIRVLDINGQELIRVQRTNSDIAMSSPDELQNKSQRYYFQHTIGLEQGEVFVSPLDLNVENGIVERPFKPMIRLATPVFSTTGEKAGIAIINLRGDYLLSQLQTFTQNAIGEIMMVNSKGYWLYGGGEKNWGFMFNDLKTSTFGNQHPDIWRQVTEHESGNIETQSQLVTFQTIQLISSTEPTSHSIRSTYSQQPTWKLINQLPTTQFNSQLSATRNLMFVLFFSVTSLIGFAALLLARTLINRRRFQDKIQELAFHDHLTGLCNRRLFAEKMEQELARARRDSCGLALMYFDLDYFKSINDELGHDAGDEALKETAQRIKSHLRDCDIVARLGGDEFAALLPKPGTIDDLTHIAERILNCFAPPFILFGHKRHLGLSIGIAIHSDRNETSFLLTKRADQAMYQAKRSGRNCMQFADAKQQNRSESEHSEQ